MKFLKKQYFSLLIKIDETVAVKFTEFSFEIAEKIPFHYSCILGKQKTVNLPLQNRAALIPFCKPTDNLRRSSINRFITFAVYNVFCKKSVQYSTVLLYPCIKISAHAPFLRAHFPSLFLSNTIGATLALVSFIKSSGESST